MNNFTYYIYDGGELIAGFTSLYTAVCFAEEWNGGRRPVNLVAADSGEVIDTYSRGAWGNEGW